MPRAKKSVPDHANAGSNDNQTTGYQIVFKPTNRNIEWQKKGLITIGEPYEVVDRFYDKGTLKFLIADNLSNFQFIILDTEQIGCYSGE